MDERKGSGRMTLKEMVGKYDINVKIGCKNGNAFVYCGNLNSLDIRQKDLDLINNLTMMINNYDSRVGFCL